MFTWAWLILLYLALPVLILVSCVRVVIRATTVGRKGPSAPACERCKYPVEGLSGWQCPECGSDVRQVGIITRTMEVRRRGTMGGAILALTVGALDLGIVGAWVGWWAYLTWGGGMAAMGMGPTTMTTPLTPSSGAYTSVTIESTYDPTAPTSASGFGGTVIYRLELDDGSIWVLEFDVATSMASAFDGRGQGVELLQNQVGVSNQVGIGTIEEFFEAAGLDSSDLAVSTEISDLHSSALRLVQMPFQDPATLGYSRFQVGATSTTTAPGAGGAGSTVDWWQVILWSVIGTSAALWIGGLVWIIVRRRKLLGEHGFVVAAAEVTA